MPKGGLLPYLPADKQDQLGILPAMESIIGGGAQKIIAAAKEGDMAAVAQQITPLLQGCVTCHALFRGTPGVVPLPAGATPGKP